MIWNVFNKLFRLPRKLRQFYYLYFNKVIFALSGVKYGQNMKVYNKVYLNVKEGAEVTIGDDFVMTSGEAFNPLCRVQRGIIYAEPGAKISIGNDTGMSSPCIWTHVSITVGSHVKVGGDCIILDTDCHNLDWRIRRSKAQVRDGRCIDEASANSASIVIEDDVMIGTRCIILKGVTIGARSIIGSGSVVTQSIPADCIAAGNPCRVIKRLA